MKKWKILNSILYLSLLYWKKIIKSVDLHKAYKIINKFQIRQEIALFSQSVLNELSW